MLRAKQLAVVHGKPQSRTFKSATRASNSSHKLNSYIPKKAPEAATPRVRKNRRLSGRHQALTQILHQPFGEMSPATDLQDEGGSNSLQLLHFEEPLGLP